MKKLITVNAFRSFFDLTHKIPITVQVGTLLFFTPLVAIQAENLSEPNTRSLSGIKNPIITEITQTKKISGTIKDEKGEAVIGATVSVKGTTEGTITDLDGKFSLDVPANGSLQISYVGYIQQLKIGRAHV